METLDKIQNELRENKLIGNPHQCAEYVGILSGELAFYLSKQSDLEQERSKNWLELREGFKSDTATSKAWSFTKEGIEYEWYESRCKRIKACLTGLRTLIRLAETEQHNLG